LRGTKANKERASEWVGDLTHGGGTNYEAAFTKAFEVLDNSRKYWRRSDINSDGPQSARCETAILFLSDGEVSSGKTGKSLLNHIDALNVDKFDSTDKPDYKKAVLFTFSLGNSIEQEAKETLKLMACEQSGVWQHVMDSGDLTSQMSLYYEYFAAGLSENSSEAVQAVWVEPYYFKTGNVYGTSVQKAVFDRRTNPPTLLGVMSVGISVDDLIDLSPDWEESIRVYSSTCPNLVLSECQRQSIRRKGGNDKLCSSSSCEIVDLHPAPCPGSTLPDNIWKNLDHWTVDAQGGERSLECYEKRGCCADCHAEKGQCAASRLLSLFVLASALIFIIF